LFDQAADHSNERDVAAPRQFKVALERGLVCLFGLQSLRVVILCQIGISRGVPCAYVDTVHDTGDHSRALREQSVQSTTKLRRLNLVSVAGAHGVDAVGVD
jgi:hypothetical protein